MVTLELILKTCQSIKTLGKSRVKRSTVYRMTLKCIFLLNQYMGRKFIGDTASKQNFWKSHRKTIVSEFLLNKTPG